MTTNPAETLARRFDELEHRELCSHHGEPRSFRIAHGYLGDSPAGTRQTLCDACGSVLHEVPPCSVCGDVAVVKYVAVLPDSSLDPRLGARCFEHRARSGEAEHAYRVEFGEVVDTRPSPWSPITPPEGMVAVKVTAGGSISAEERLDRFDLSEPYLLEELLERLVGELRWTHSGEAVALENVAVSVAVPKSASLRPARAGDFDVFVDDVRGMIHRLARQEVRS